MRSDEVVPIERRKIEKLLRDFDANSMQSLILRTGPAIAVTVKAGDRIAAATLQVGAENVRGHARH